MATPVLVRTTVDSEKKARVLARAVVAEHLAACAKITAVRSVYRWKGELEEAKEWLVEALTSAELAAPTATRFAKGHPYDVPVIETWPVELADAETVRWLGEALQGSKIQGSQDTS